MDIDINVKWKPISHLEENRRENQCVLDLEWVCRYNSKSMIHEKEIDKLDFTKILKVGFLKDTVKRVKIKAQT